MTGEDKKVVEIVTNSPSETIELGKRLGGALKGGEVICLTGALGSGKTHLIKGICRGAGVEDEDAVNSPTFVLINEYFAPGWGLEIYHIDAYRLESVDEFERLGFDDICHERSVVMIEWADKIASALENINSIDVSLSHEGESKRRILIENISEDIFSRINS